MPALSSAVFILATPYWRDRAERVRTATLLACRRTSLLASFLQLSSCQVPPRDVTRPPPKAVVSRPGSHSDTQLGVHTANFRRVDLMIGRWRARPGAKALPQECVAGAFHSGR